MRRKLGLEEMLKLWRRYGGGRIRGICSAVIRGSDEGDWIYSSEWWNPDGGNSRTVFRESSVKGNGLVSVVAFPSSRPSREEWKGGQKWLRRKMCLLLSERGEEWVVRGYQWRMLMFNHTTRQSTVKVMVASTRSDPGSMLLLQQPHCIPIPYLKSFISAGMTAMCASNYNLTEAACGRRTMRILCIGHGGGSLPLFLATKIEGAVVDSVEIDPVVVSASVLAMGFPASSVVSPSIKRRPMDETLWRGVWDRVSVHQVDAEDFITGSGEIYDMVFVDAYDGDDIFPHRLWGRGSVFLGALSKRVHSDHGTVVVNLHSDYSDDSVGGKYVCGVSQSYVEALIGGDGCRNCVGFAVRAPHLCNTTVVVCRGMTGDCVVDNLLSKCVEVQNALHLPFSCFEYVKRGFVLVH